MKLIGLALAGLLVGVAPAFAQYAPRPPAPIGPMANDVFEIVEAMGLDPIGAPARSGAFYVQRAVDDFGRVLHVTVDARRSQVIAIEAAGALRTYGYAGYGQRRAYPGYIDPDDDFDLAPPGSVLGARAQPPRRLPPSTTSPRPAAKSAAVAPQRPPVPRKRPAAAPEQAFGSVEPVAPAPQQAPSAAPSEQPVPAKPAGPVLPPVAPLE